MHQMLCFLDGGRKLKNPEVLDKNMQNLIQIETEAHELQGPA